MGDPHVGCRLKFSIFVVCQSQSIIKNASLLFTFFIFKHFVEHFFRVYIASSKQEDGWENSRQLCKP